MYSLGQLTFIKYIQQTSKNVLTGDKIHTMEIKKYPNGG